ncbi:FAD binding domain-containing protein [Ancylobacter defluvii]|uniref:Molybdopterin dehydrogenase n=1 Tax=Ancylobacter defluvii TaxID=1282440 RepID=A0A9W6JXW5_9HYPH|nr:xanthine dehydrogenase family protein subunit M [Ancylobacter defluvii]MBS7586600.1 xanthine dehydrogenase family protein subunit M [Ancylobacter defluvii]GLK85890.1 molybdopterin dehydrogenase [Ancylobacter defluvii]
MKARAFDYIRPATVAEALAAFAEAEGDASYIAGGQSLIPALALRLQAPARLIDIGHIAALRGIAVEDGWLRLGALTRHVEAHDHPLIAVHAPLLALAAPYVAHPAIRNRGTLGGSVALADPASEFPAMMLAMAAEIEIVGAEGTRRVPADAFFQDLYQTALEPGELLAALHIPVARPEQRCAFDEIARRRGDYALVGCGIRLTMPRDRVEEAHIAFLAVGPTPMRAPAAEAALIGARLDAEAIRRAQAALARDLDPPEDGEVPPAMRLHLARVLLGRLLGRLQDQIAEAA